VAKEGASGRPEWIKRRQRNNSGWRPRKKLEERSRKELQRGQGIHRLKCRPRNKSGRR
jgi:hypothetical protein